jgi:hypothetical protein
VLGVAVYAVRWRRAPAACRAMGKVADVCFVGGLGATRFSLSDVRVSATRDRKFRRRLADRHPQRRLLCARWRCHSNSRPPVQTGRRGIRPHSRIYFARIVYPPMIICIWHYAKGV